MLCNLLAALQKNVFRPPYVWTLKMKAGFHSKISEPVYESTQCHAFFFFSRRYNPWWVLACFTILFHNLLSLHFSLQFNHNPFHALVVFFCICRNYYLQPSQQRKFFQGAVASRTPNPLPRRTGVSLLVWVITFDLSGKGDPTSSYATAGVALRIIWPLKPSHYFKVETPSGGQLGYHTYIMYGLIE